MVTSSEVGVRVGVIVRIQGCRLQVQTLTALWQCRNKPMCAERGQRSTMCQCGNILPAAGAVGGVASPRGRRAAAGGGMPVRTFSSMMWWCRKVGARLADPQAQAGTTKWSIDGARLCSRALAVLCRRLEGVLLHCSSCEELEVGVVGRGCSLAASGHEERCAAAGHRRQARHVAGTLCRIHTWCCCKVVMEGGPPCSAPKSGKWGNGCSVDCRRCRRSMAGAWGRGRSRARPCPRGLSIRVLGQRVSLDSNVHGGKSWAACSNAGCRESMGRLGSGAKIVRSEHGGRNSTSGVGWGQAMPQ